MFRNYVVILCLLQPSATKALSRRRTIKYGRKKTQTSRDARCSLSFSVSQNLWTKQGHSMVWFRFRVFFFFCLFFTRSTVLLPYSQLSGDADCMAAEISRRTQQRLDDESYLPYATSLGNDNRTITRSKH